MRRNDQILLHSSGVRLFPGVFSVSDLKQEESIEDGGFPFSGQTGELELPNVRYRYYISLSQVDASNEAVELSDLKYSLSFIRRMDNPAVHFRQPYRRVTRFDFETISKGRIFWSRTGYFSLFNALPIILRLQFEFDEVVDHGTLENINYIMKFKRISDFVRRTIVSVGTLLQETEERWKELQLKTFSNHINSFDQIYFSTEDGQSDDSIGQQLKHFRELFEVFGSEIDGDDLLSNIMSVVTSEDGIASERLFERHFAQL
ncbi:hypothetical protein [Paraburkholderia sp. J7]|uniref:hypothetical protein n=1 Tax=Paraburkholderia sp. J7 TaxID=2805438 RepID=UPI002AB66CDD|nr:hypothetical protein [Paraburkholderia sp. J7]